MTAIKKRAAVSDQASRSTMHSIADDGPSAATVVNSRGKLFFNDQNSTGWDGYHFRKEFKLAQSKPPLTPLFFFIEMTDGITLPDSAHPIIISSSSSTISDPATISLPNSSRSTPEMTDVDHSNGAGGHREPVIQSRGPRYLPPPRGAKHWSEPGADGHREPVTQSLGPRYLPPPRGAKHWPKPTASTQAVNGSEPTPCPPAQEGVYPRSHEAQESAPIMAVEGLVPFPQIPASRQPLNRITQESSASLQVDGYGQGSRGYNSTTEVSARQQARHPTDDQFFNWRVHNIAEASNSSARQWARHPTDDRFYNWRVHNTAKASNSSARDPLHVGSQTMAEPEARHPLNHSAAAQPAMNHDPCHDSPFTTANGVPYGGPVLRPARTNTARRPNKSGPDQSRHRRLNPLRDLPGLVPIADSTPADERQPLNHGPRHDSPLTTANGVPYGGPVLRPARTNTARRPNKSGPDQSRHRRLNPLRDLPGLVPIADSTPADERQPLPGTRLTPYPPRPLAGRRLDEWAAGSRPPVQHPGITGPLGPPLKPFDGPKAEAIAQEQWGVVMRENRRRR